MFKEKFCILIIYVFMTYQKWHNYFFCWYVMISINNDYTELVLKHKLNIDMYY